MTLERASELVKALGGGDDSIDLFCHFERYFKLAEQDKDGTALKRFAEMCGFGIATNVTLL